MASLTKTINRGVALLQEGKPERAAELYREVLERSPENPDALHLLSVAVYQLGDLLQAAAFAEHAVRLLPDAADYHSNLGRYYISLGRLGEAVTTLDRALTLAPTHALARFNLALALGNARRWEESLVHLRQYTHLKPDDAGGHHQLGLALSELGRAAEAVPHFCRTIELKPEAAEAYNNLGNAMQAIGQPRESIAFYEEAARRRPGYADAITNLGAAHQALGDTAAALACFNEALRLSPGLVHARGNVANLLASERRHEEAIEIFSALVAEAPHSAETWNNLGNSLQELGRFDEAMTAYARALDINPGYYLVHNNVGNTLRRQGRYEEAVAEYRRALAAKPDFVEALNNQAVALADLGHAAEAVELYQRARQIKPDYVDPLINLGNIYRDRGRPEQAIELFRRATEVAPGNPFGWNNLACALSDQGEVRQALAGFARSLELHPDNPHAHSNLLLNLHYTGDYGVAEIAEAHRQYGARFGRARGAGQHRNLAQTDRSLRVGYVSADFRRHSVAFFIEPLIERHNRAAFEVYCYADVARPDGITRRLEALAGAGWRDIRGFNDTRFADLVAADGIDILVDLGGHTANSRVASFAAHPAPVQIAYLGYPNTTGLAAMDYRLTDATADPEASPAWHSEELVRLPGGFLCFRPPENSPAVSPLPALAGAPFTFGSFNNMAKVSDGAVAAWAEILGRVPGSRLALKNKALGDTPARLRLQARFAAHGIGPERLWMSGTIDSLAGHLGAYSFVDLALDTFPYTGTTTTCEALWMGVPVVSHAGGAHVERVGASVLAAAGLPEFAVAGVGNYIELAVATAAAPEHLAGVRASLRQRLERSLLLDEPGFTLRLETAYRQLWRRWCAERTR
jgi:protein O-GlcNAc transferase